jgi:outer membrane usher protein
MRKTFQKLRRWTSIEGRALRGLAALVASLLALAISAAGQAPNVSSPTDDAPPPLQATLISADAASADPDPDGSPQSGRSATPRDRERSSPTLLYVAVTINGKPIADFIQVVRMPSGRFMVPPQCFTAAHVNVPSTRALNFAGSTFVPLDTVPGVRYDFDESQQALNITVPANDFELSRIDMQHRHSYPPTQPSPGFVLNHDLEVLGFDRRVQATGAFEAVAFGFGGVLTNSVLAGDLTSMRSVRRLNTQFMRELPDRMRVLTVGDALSSGTSWTRQLHFAGVQWASNFAIQPSFIPFALPGIQGQAAEPSTLDLYVNSVRTVSRPVNAGPFTIDNIPIITSQGDIQMVLTDALGRQQVVTAPYISTPQLLRKGVHDFSYQAGVMRWGIGTFSDSYRRAFAAGGHRFGITDRFTVGGEGEVAGISQAGGLDAYWGLLNLGTLSAGAALSHSDRGIGKLAHLELSNRRPRFGFGGGAQFATKSFQQLGLGDVGTPRFQLQGQAWYSFHRSASFGLAYVAQEYYRNPTVSTTSFRTVGGSLNLRVGRFGYLSWTTNYAPKAARHVSSFMTFSVPLGMRRSAMLSTSYDGDHVAGTAAISQSLPIGDGIGYRARYNSDSSTVESGFDAQNRWGTYTVEAGRNNTGTSYRLAERSGFAYLENRFLPTRWLNDSFALVELPDSKGVSVYANNQYVTKTDRRGLAVVPMVPYDANAVRLDDQNVPIEIAMDMGERVVVPMSRTGVLLKFKAEQNRGMTVILTMPDGSFVPPGTEVRIERTGETAIVGYDGEVYVENLSLPAILVARPGDNECRAEVPFTENKAPLPRIGPFQCTSK